MRLSRLKFRQSKASKIQELETALSRTMVDVTKLSLDLWETTERVAELERRMTYLRPRPSTPTIPTPEETTEESRSRPTPTASETTASSAVGRRRTMETPAALWTITDITYDTPRPRGGSTGTE